jgi:hypothetical protein
MNFVIVIFGSTQKRPPDFDFARNWILKSGKRQSSDVDHRNPTSRSRIVCFFPAKSFSWIHAGNGAVQQLTPADRVARLVNMHQIWQKLAIVSKNIWSPCPLSTRRYWGRAKADSFSHFSLPQKSHYSTLDVGFIEIIDLEHVCWHRSCKYLRRKNTL